MGGKSLGSFLPRQPALFNPRRDHIPGASHFQVQAIIERAVYPSKPEKEQEATKTLEIRGCFCTPGATCARPKLESQTSAFIMQNWRMRSTKIAGGRLLILRCFGMKKFTVNNASISKYSIYERVLFGFIYIYIFKKIGQFFFFLNENNFLFDIENPRLLYFAVVLIYFTEVT